MRNVLRNLLPRSPAQASSPSGAAPAKTDTVRGNSNSLRREATKLLNKITGAPTGQPTARAYPQANFAQPYVRANPAAPRTPRAQAVRPNMSVQSASPSSDSSYDDCLPINPQLKKFVQLMGPKKDLSYLHAFYERTEDPTSLDTPFNTPPREFGLINAQLNNFLDAAAIKPSEQLKDLGIMYVADAVTDEKFAIQTGFNSNGQPLFHMRTEDEIAVHLLLEKHFEAFTATAPLQSPAAASVQPFALEVFDMSDSHGNSLKSIGSHATEFIELDSRLCSVVKSHTLQKMSSTDNNCWMRAAWCSALQQHAPNQGIDELKQRLLGSKHLGAEYSEDIKNVCDQALSSLQRDGVCEEKVEKSMQRLTFALLDGNTNPTHSEAKKAVNNAVCNGSAMGEGEHIASLIKILGADCIVLVKDTNVKDEGFGNERLSEPAEPEQFAVMHADSKTGKRIFSLENDATGEDAIKTLAAKLQHRPIIFQDNINNHLHFDVLMPRLSQPSNV